MNNKRVVHILDALIQGVDPVTGEELLPGTPLQNADVLRALLAGKVAVESLADRETRRKMLPDNVGRAWSDEEEATLVATFKSGDPVADIAARHGRTVRAIEARLVRLGLLTVEQRTTGDSFIDKAGKTL